MLGRPEQQVSRARPRAHAHTSRLCADGAADSPQVNDAPRVRVEPRRRDGVHLVLADQDGVRHGQQAHQGPVLEELQDFGLIRQTPDHREEVKKKKKKMSERKRTTKETADVQKRECVANNSCPPRKYLQLNSRTFMNSRVC